MKKEIATGNILIAKFMGEQIEPNMFPYCMVRRYDVYIRAFYEDSWDWLMPVVEKIGNIPQHGYSFKRDLDGGLFIGIENVWRIVVEFIEWYNSVKD